MIKLEASRFIHDMKKLEGVTRRAAVFALNDSAKDVHSFIKRRMKEKFDNPVPYTLNHFFVWRAQVRDDVPFSEVRRRPSAAPLHYIAVQERGGPRPKTRLERMVEAKLPYSGIFGGVTPSYGAKLDKYGNWSSGQRNQVLTALKAWREIGYSANATEASKKRKKKAEDPERKLAYFLAQPGGELKPGIWARAPGELKDDGKRGPGPIHKVVNIVDRAPRYRAVLGIYDGAETVFAAGYPDHYARILDRLRSKSGK